MADSRARGGWLLKDAVSQGFACPTVPKLGALRSGSLPRGEAAALSTHVAGCPRCENELLLLATFEDTAPRPGELDALRSIAAQIERRFSGERTRPPETRGFARVLLFPRSQAGGLTATAAMLIATMGNAQPEGPPPELRSQPLETGDFRSGQVAVFSPSGDLPEAPAELCWQPLAAAASYSVRVMEADHTELWSAETRHTAVALPAQVRERIVPRKPLLWEVVALHAEGNPLASSGTQRFQIRNQP